MPGIPRDPRELKPPPQGGKHPYLGHGVKIVDPLGNEGFCLAAISSNPQDQLVWVNYFKAVVYWVLEGVPASQVPSHSPGVQRDPPGSTGFYPFQNGAGTRAAGEGDVPDYKVKGVTVPWRVLQSDPEIFLEIVWQNWASGLMPDNIVYLCFELQITSVLVNVRTHEVAQAWSTIKTVIYDASADPQLTQKVVGPTGTIDARVQI